MRDTPVSVAVKHNASPAARASGAPKPAPRTGALTGADEEFVGRPRAVAADGALSVALDRTEGLPISAREIALLGAWLTDPSSVADRTAAALWFAPAPLVDAQSPAEGILDDNALWDAPFGYAVSLDRRTKRPICLVAHPEEAEIVAGVIHLASPTGGALSMRRTVEVLDEAGYVGRDGAAITVSRVAQILSSDHYATGGSIPARRRYAHRSRTLSLIAPALVASATFQEARQARQHRRPENTAPRLTNGPTLLLGVMRCGRCDGKIVVRTRNSGRARDLVCAGSGTASPGCGLAHPMDRIDKLVLDTVADAALAPPRVAALAAALSERRDARVAALEARLRATRRQVDRARTEVARVLSRVREHRQVALGTVRHLGAKEGAVSTGSVRLNALEHALAALRAGAGMPVRADILSELVRDRLGAACPQVRKEWCGLYVAAVTLELAKVTISLKGVAAQPADTRAVESQPVPNPPRGIAAPAHRQVATTDAGPATQCQPLHGAPYTVGAASGCLISYDKGIQRIAVDGYAYQAEVTFGETTPLRSTVAPASAPFVGRMAPGSATALVGSKRSDGDQRPGYSRHDVADRGNQSVYCTAPESHGLPTTVEEHPAAQDHAPTRSQPASWCSALRIVAQSAAPAYPWTVVRTLRVCNHVSPAIQRT